MKLYYTVASQQDVAQPKPNLSLGGYKSSTVVPNSVLGNMFADISMYTVKNYTSPSYIGLILVNDSATEKAIDVNLWFKHLDDCITTFKVAAVDLTTDAEGEKYMEHIPNFNSKPLYATFSEADGEVNRVSIGDILAGGMVGLWFERTIDIATAKTQQNAIYEVDPADPYRYLPVELSKEDQVDIGISWDLE